jgi:ABC-type multidrug transport system fused ATPase/permease subunit
MAMKEPSYKHEPDLAFLAEAKASVSRSTNQAEDSSQSEKKKRLVFSLILSQVPKIVFIFVVVNVIILVICYYAVFCRDSVERRFIFYMIVVLVSFIAYGLKELPVVMLIIWNLNNLYSGICARC